MRLLCQIALLFIGVISFFSNFSLAHSDILHFRHITVDDGLPSSKIFYLWQDKKKYVWIGTQHGVAKYNGNQFQTFRIQDGLVNNAVWGLNEAPPGHMRFITHNQIVAGYNGDSIQHFSLPKEKGLGQITHFAWLKKDSSLWFGGQKGLFRQKNGELTHFTHVNSPIKKEHKRCSKIRAIHNSIWIVNHDQVLRWDSTGFQVIWERDTKGDISNFNIEKTTNKSFLFHGSKFYTIEDDTIVYQGRTKGDFQIRKILYVDNNFWLFSTQGEVKIYNSDNQLKNTFDIFLDKTITDVLQDHENNVWIATQYNGLYLIDDQARKTILLNESNGLISQNLISIKGREDSTICLGSYKGTVSFFHNGRIINKKILSGTPSTHMAVQDVQPLERKGWLIGTDMGLYYLADLKAHPIRIDAKSKDYKWRQVQFNQQKGTPLSIKCIEKGNTDSTYFIGSHKAIHELRVSENEGKKRYWYIRKLKEHRVRTISIKKNTIWAGNFAGLKQYLYDSGQLKHIKHHLPNNKIKDIQIAPNNEVWVATEGRGIKVYDKQKWKTVPSQTRHMPNNLHIGSQESVWVATNNGLKRISRDIPTSSSSKKINTYRNFLPTQEVSDVYGYGNVLWLATNKGAISVNKNILSKEEKRNIPINIREVKVERNSVDLSDTISIPYHQNSISISYSGICFDRPESLEYRYKLKPNNKWLFTNEDFINFSSLKPDQYKFIVEARLKNGTWSHQPATYSFTISPPFYKQPLFLGGISFGGIGIAILFVLLRFQQVKRREKQKAYYERKLTEFELQAIENQMNPHFIYNVLNSIQSLILNKRFKETNIYISRFGKLLRQVLESSKKEMTTLQNEVDLLRNYLELESLRFQGNFDYFIDIDNEIDSLNVQIPPFFIQPFVENSLKHAFNEIDQLAKIDIIMYKDDDRLICRVIDNGKGFDNTDSNHKNGLNLTKMSSYGISLIKEKSEILKKTKGLDIDIEYIAHGNQYAQEGTKVEIRFPYLNLA